VSVNEEEENPRSDHAHVFNSDVDAIKQDVKSVEMVSVEEDLKHFSPEPRKAWHPHR